MSNFFILGLPRSRTTWLSAYLLTDRVFCAHDVFSSEDLYPEEFWGLSSYEYTGSVDTDSVLATPYLRNVEAPLVIIDRCHREVYESLSRIPNIDKDKLKYHLTNQMDALEEAKSFANLVVPYDKLDDMMEELSYVCTPNVPFDKVKHAAFKGFNIRMPNLCGKAFNGRVRLWQQ